MLNTLPLLIGGRLCAQCFVSTISFIFYRSFFPAQSRPYRSSICVLTHCTLTPAHLNVFTLGISAVLYIRIRKPTPLLPLPSRSSSIASSSISIAAYPLYTVTTSTTAHPLVFVTVCSRLSIFTNRLLPHQRFRKPYSLLQRFGGDNTHDSCL